MVVAAPLLVLGRPLGRLGLGASRRPGGPAPAASSIARAGAVLAALTHPLTAWMPARAGALGLAPARRCSRRRSRIRPCTRCSTRAFSATALMFWWTTLGRDRRASGGAALASLFTTMLHTGALGALMTLSPLLWYPHYAATRAAFGLDPLADQQLGGLIMWIRRRGRLPRRPASSWRRAGCRPARACGRT